MKLLARPIAYLVAANILLGCEGGGITGTGLDIPVSVGVITNFGSVVVNGVKFDVSASRFKIDDLEGLETDLKVGMIVSVAGSINTDGASGTATQVVFADDVEGTVMVNNIKTDNTLTVLGQTIHVDADTTFESQVTSVATLEQIVVGNIVQVSGYNSGDGNIYATRIDVKKESTTNGEQVEVTGSVKTATATTFQIGSLTVNYSNAELNDIPNNIISDGQFVEVKSTKGFNNQSELIAEKVELQGDGTKKFEVENGKELELEGVISQLDLNAGTFVVNGQVIRLTDSTLLLTLSNGQKIKVDGIVDDSGILVVSGSDEVETKQESNIQASGLVEGVDAANGTLALFGQTIHLSSTTSMNDEREQGRVRQFTIGNISIGDYVKISAYRDSANIWQATKLERDDAEDNGVSLQGTVDELNNDIITVAGVRVDISQTVDFQVSVGDKVEIEGSYSSANQTIIAGEESELDERSDSSEESSKPDYDED